MFFNNFVTVLDNRKENTVIKFMVQEELQIFRQKFLVEQNKEEDN